MEKFFIFLVFYVIYCDAADYCALSKQHTMCLYNSTEPSKNCSGFPKYELSQEDIAEILKQHNEFRKSFLVDKASLPKAVGIPDLQWDNELAEIAQRWANQCQFKNDLFRDSKRKMTVGQNIAVKSVGNISELVATWFAQRSKLTPELVRNFKKDGLEDYGQVSQIIWSLTERIGCGLSIYNMTSNNCPENKTCRFDSVVSELVCNYGPAGNIEGQSIYKTTDIKRADSGISSVTDVWDRSYKIIKKQQDDEGEGGEGGEGGGGGGGGGTGNGDGNGNNTGVSLIGNVPGLTFMAVSHAVLRIFN